VIHSVSTVRQHCHKYPKSTCGYVILYHYVLDTFKCESVLVTAHSIGLQLPENIQKCNSTVDVMILKYIFKPDTLTQVQANCYSKQACIQVKYLMQLEQTTTTGTDTATGK
jgi:hypothetical protein